ncbi:MAG: PH domain-containing protein [Acidimicrobiales bacterium]|jgi:membrane protein YdbS with pleckstrin-like domain
MAFPRKLLAPGEEIVLETHPNWSILVPRASLFVLVVAGCVAVVVEWKSAPLWVGYVLLGVAALFLLWVLGKVVTWRSTSLVLTNMRVVYRTGVVRRLGREIPLDRVQDVTYTQSIVERLVGAGSLTIQSAGAGGDEPFPDIRHPALVQSLINRLISQPGPGYARGSGGVAGRPAYAPQAEYQPEQPAAQPPYPAQPPPQMPQPQYPAPAHYPAPAQPPYQPQPPYTAPPQQYAAQQPYPGQAPYPTQPQPQYPPREPYLPQPPYETAVQATRPLGSAPPDGTPATSSPSSPGPAADERRVSSSEQLQHLAELLRLGVITEAEYDAKRREVLEGG